MTSGTKSGDSVREPLSVALNGMLLGGYFSGVEVTIRELAGNLQDYGTGQIHFFIPGYAEYRKTSNPDFHVVRAYILRHSRIRRILWEHFILPFRIRQTGCRILHCPGYVSPLYSLVPVVLTVHDCFAWTHPALCKRENRLHYRMLLPRSVRNAAKIIVPSEYVKTELIRVLRVPVGKIRVIPFAPSGAFRTEANADWQDAIRRKHALPETYVLFVGNIEPKKNLPGILRGFSRYLQRGGTASKLVLCGKESWGVDLQREIRDSALEPHVIRLGHVPLSELAAIYSMAGAFLFPSLTEGFGIPVLEAMSSGIPVITSRNGALSETAGTAAEFVHPERPEEIAESLLKLERSEEARHALVEQGRIHAARYSWRRTVEMTEEVYHEI
jgi:glycosyltransferase involved in cell wall biosynthesis